MAQDSEKGNKVSPTNWEVVSTELRADRDEWERLWKKASMAVLDLQGKLNDLSASSKAVGLKYHELLMAVERKTPGETRHETALRYIVQSEVCNDDAAKAGDDVGERYPSQT